MSSRPPIYLVTFVTPDFLLPDGRPKFPPLAALYLAGALRKSGAQPRVLHLLPEHVDRLSAMLESDRPEWVGFSTLTGSALTAVIESSRRVRKMGIPVVWGGVHASTAPELALREFADHVVIGEAEKSVVELAEFIRSEKSASGADLPSTGDFSESLDDYPPAWDMIDPAQYINAAYSGGAMPFFFTRGCPYRCRFCYNEAMREGRWRRHSDEYLAETLDYLRKRAPFSTVDFSDDYTFEKPGKSSSWVDVLTRRGLRWAASFRAGALTPDFVRWLEDNGCIEVRIGMESGHPETLKYLAKNIKVEDLYMAAESLAATKISAMAGFVINWPGETRESILATLKTTDDLARINPRMRFNLGYYIPMPGTPVYREALQDGFVEPQSNEEWAEIFRHPYRYRGFNEREIEALEIISGRLYRHYLKPWPMQKLLEPAMRWRWRRGYFKWFAIGAARRAVKSLTGMKASPMTHNSD